METKKSGYHYLAYFFGGAFLALSGAGFPLACAPAPVVPAALVGEPAPGAAPSASVSAIASATVSASASAAPAPVVSASRTPAPVAPSAEPAPPPCIDGEILMGMCICPKGKGADDTGHCVFMPCPKSTAGGTVFRDKTGQCKECRAGTTPSPDGTCLH